MSNLKLITLMLFIFLGSLTAQNFIGKINPSSAVQQTKYAPGDTLNILAVMVEFQIDDDATTFGNGKFGSIYSKAYADTILDPLPHDVDYFAAHLEFVKNYFAKVSKEKLHVNYSVLPEIVTADKTMKSYSPPIKSDDFSSLADLSSEVWNKVDSAFSNFEFDNYDMFIIFHAGAGRDISLPGSLGNERDLPSIYMGLNLFRMIYGNSFEGFDVNSGKFKITNTAIIPETESRELSSFGGTVLFEISINGLLAATVGSHLGLPDLFDTETGLSAIGRFGLMDGQSIFAYNGIFPPELSAWEKIFLGWAEPVTLQLGNHNVSLAANAIANFPDTVILKVPITSAEYFLLENRARDANKDGARLRVKKGDGLHNLVFEKDTTGFYYFSVTKVDGVVLDVDEFDWALPGSGILIWHIDEKIINSKLADNKINTDKFLRGVDLEEADGIQDIGEKFTTVLGDVIVGEGTSEDFWFASNQVELYKNRFDKQSRPNSKSNSGANSLISIKDFSDISNKMSFTVSYGDSLVVPILSKKISLPGTINKMTYSSFGDSISLLMLSAGSLYSYDLAGNLLNVQPDFSEYKPAVFYNADKEIIAGVKDSRINILARSQQRIPLFSFDAGKKITAAPVINLRLDNKIYLFIGAENDLFIYDITQYPAQLPILIDQKILDGTAPIISIAVDDQYYALLQTSALQENNSPWNSNEMNQKGVFILQDNLGNIYEGDGYANQFALTKNSSGERVSVVLTDDAKIRILVNGKLKNEFQAGENSTGKSFALADLKNDGENYIIIISGNVIETYSLSGARAQNFPLVDPTLTGFDGFILAADFEGDKKSEIIGISLEGNVAAADGGSAKIINGFPFSAGARLSAYPLLFQDKENRTVLAALSMENELSIWEIGNPPGKIYWGGEMGNPSNSLFVGSASGTPPSTDFFPKSRAYNYPNPVYENFTFIRYYVSEDSKVLIKIFDLAGDLVDEITSSAIGGMDNEVKWDVSNIQSGVYLARLEASSSSGKTETNIIKIAVVK